MRKGIAFLLVTALILTSFAVAFAAEVSAPADVKGTEYEAAVTALMEKGIITGYTDGSFRPENTITRAEACIIVVKAMAPAEKALKEAAKSSFSDLADYAWAAESINYAAAKGVISGYPNGTFRPAGNVTYAELASMLVRALGYGSEDLTGDWPDNFITKAATLGVFTDIDHKVDNVNASAVRGHVALMAYRVADDIEEANKPDATTDPGEDKGDGETDDKAGFLSDFTGRAYGILLSVAKVLNEKGDTVDEYEFLIGQNTLFIKTNGKITADTAAKIEEHFEAGNLYGLRMSDGVVTKFDTSDKGFAEIGSPKGFEDFTGEWAEVESVSNYVVKTKAEYGEDGKKRDSFTVLNDASIYVAEVEKGEITGYKAGTIRDVKAGKSVRLYSVTGNDPGVVEVVLVKDSSEK